MISKETLEAVRKGILTDTQLDEALKHYRQLVEDLQCHGEVYKLVWKDAYLTLTILEGFKLSRK